MWMSPEYQLPEPPPYNGAWTLRKKREEIILASLRGGHNYEAAKSFAEAHIPDADIERANETYRRETAAWDAREQERLQPAKRPWWDFFGLSL